MKKNLFMVAAVALVAVVSCNKEEINNGSTADSVMPGDAVEFIAVADADSKTSLNGEETHWVSGDAISVNGYEFTTTDSGAEAKFRRTEAFEAAETYNAVYPSAAGSSFETITIPAVQKAVAGQFPTDENGVVAVVSVASSSTNTLEFKNVTSMLKFSVPEFETAITSVSITSDSYLAGTVSVDYNNGDPVATVKEGSKTITVNGSFEPGSEYYVVALPGEHTFTVRINGYLSKASDKKAKINRSKVASMKELPAPVATEWVLKGAFDSWGKGKTFYKDVNGRYLLQDFTIDATKEIKLYYKNATKEEWLRTAANIALSNKWYKIGQYDGGNGRLLKGAYDIYVDPTGFNVCFNDADAELTATIPQTPTATVYLNSTAYNSLWCWNKDNNAQNFTGGTWPGLSSTTNETINGKTYRKWNLSSCSLGVYLNMIFSKSGASQTGEDNNTGLLMGETMFIKLENGKARFNNDI